MNPFQLFKITPDTTLYTGSRTMLRTYQSPNHKNGFLKSALQHLGSLSTQHGQWINVIDGSSLYTDVPRLDTPSLSVSWVLSAMIQEVDLDYLAIFQGSDHAIIKVGRYPNRAVIANEMMRMGLDGYSAIFTGAVVKGSSLVGVRLEPLLLSEITADLGQATSLFTLVQQRQSTAVKGAKPVVVFC